MTKQEEIKKMATTMCGYYNDGKCIFRNCAACDKFNSQECSYKEDAEELYYAGYRKVLLNTKDGKAVDVVQYAPWQLIEGYTEREVEKARKETAKEIFNAISNNIDDPDCILIKYNKWFQSLAKQYGVEVQNE